MTDRMTTAEVVARLEAARRQLLEAVDALGPDAATTPVTEPDGWTAKDVLAHLIHYAGQIAFGLGAPNPPPPYVLGVTERLTGQQWNDRAVDHWRNSTLEQVRNEFDSVVDRLVAYAAKRTYAQMNATDAIPWAGPRPLWEINRRRHVPARMAGPHRADPRSPAPATT